MRVLGLVPARGGSKGLPGKNLRPIAGRSPVERACAVGEASGVLEQVVVSTDDPRIQGHVLGAGYQAPFLRSAELARDDTPMIEVALDLLERMEQTHLRYDALMVLQPTSPLRQVEHIRAAVARLQSCPNATAVCSVALVPPELSPHYLMQVGSDGWLRPFMEDGGRYTRRQDVPRAHRRCGTVFLTRTEVLREQRNFYGDACLPMEVEAHFAVNIDGPEDWAEAERRLCELESAPARKTA